MVENSQIQNGNTDTEESYSNPNKSARFWICSAAIFFTTVTCLQDLNLRGSWNRKGGFIIKLANSIPESLVIIASTTLWIVLFWNLKKLCSKNLQGLFTALITLEAFLGLLSLLYLLPSVEEEEGLGILAFFVGIAYFVVMLVLGVKLSDSATKTAFIIYPIGTFLMLMLGIIFSEGDDMPWWSTIIFCFLDLFLLYCIMDFEGELKKENVE
jgi:hypothetical protein